MPPHLPPNELNLFRALSKTAIVVMLMLRLDRPLGEAEIAVILDMHPETIRTYLKSLAGLGVVTRTHRYSGWTLTAGGRQMILGHTTDQLTAVGARQIGAGPDAPSNPTVPLHSGKIKTSAENPSSNAENPRSRPAASLSLSFKEEKELAAAAFNAASAENPRSSAEIWYSGTQDNGMAQKGDRTACRSERSDPVVQANLRAFASFGLSPNGLVLEICKMNHVTPDYIMGQRRRLEAERRYSHGLLLTVVRSKDKLPEKYLPREVEESPPEIAENEPELGGEPEPISTIEPDPSIYAPLAENGTTAERAWEAVKRQLKADMSKGTYEKWVKDTILLSAKDGIFVIGVCDDYARDWLECRITNILRRLLAGICGRSIEVSFINVADMRV